MVAAAVDLAARIRMEAKKARLANNAAQTAEAAQAAEAAATAAKTPKDLEREQACSRLHKLLSRLRRQRVRVVGGAAPVRFCRTRKRNRLAREYLFLELIGFMSAVREQLNIRVLDGVQAPLAVQALADVQAPPDVKDPKLLGEVCTGPCAHWHGAVVLVEDVSAPHSLAVEATAGGGGCWYTPAGKQGGLGGDCVQQVLVRACRLGCRDCAAPRTGEKLASAAHSENGEVLVARGSELPALVGLDAGMMAGPGEATRPPRAGLSGTAAASGSLVMETQAAGTTGGAGVTAGRRPETTPGEPATMGHGRGDQVAGEGKAKGIAGRVAGVLQTLTRCCRVTGGEEHDGASPGEAAAASTAGRAATATPVGEVRRGCSSGEGREEVD
jgi:hypothetical protein